MNMTLARVLRAPFSAMALASVLLAGCGGGGGGGGTPSTPPVSGNRAPVAGLALSGLLVSAGGNGDAATFSGSEVKFDASGSTDPDGDALSYSWSLVSKPAGSSLTVQGSGNQLVIKPDTAGTYVISVRISDGKGATIDKQASLVVSANAAPVAAMVVRPTYTATPSVAASTTVTVGATLVLDGTRSYDADGDPVTTTWEVIERPSGSRTGIVLDGAVSRLGTDVAGIYKLRARATDPSGAYSEAIYPFEAVGTAPTVVSVASVNNGPVDAGSATISGTTGYKISLSGAGSSNPDGLALTHAWTLVSKPAASTATLDSSTGAFSQLTPDVLGDYVVRLVVTAPSGVASSYTTTISVNNRRPLAAIGTNAVPVALPSGPTLRLPANTVVTLRGANSSDADGDALTYSWTLQTKPAGSAGSLSSTNQSTTQLTTDLSGSYIVLLRVTDPSGAYSEQPIIIASGNAAPVAVVNKGQVTVLAGTAINASAGFSYDDDNDTLSYSWALDVKPAGSSATISSTSAQLAFTPDVVGTYVASVTVSDGKASSIAYVTIKSLSSTVTTTTLPFTPLMSKYSRGLDRLVMVSASPNLLSIVDPFTGTLRQVPLPATVKSMTLSPDGKLAAVLHEGVVSLVDLENASLVRSSTTNGTQTEAFVTNDALIYLVGQSNSYSSLLVVINGKTGADVSATYSRVQNGYYYSSGNVRGVYSGVNRKAIWSSESSYYDMASFSLDANGVATTMGGASFYGYGSSPLFLSASENLVFSASGNYFRTDTLAYAGTLNISGITALSHSASADELIATTATREYDYSGSGPYPLVYTYDTSYRRFTGSLFFADTNITLPLIGGLQSYGMAVYHGTNDKHVALVQTGGAKSNASGLKYYVAVTR